MENQLAISQKPINTFSTLMIGWKWLVIRRDDVKVKSVLHTTDYYWSVNSTRYTINRSSQEKVFFLRFNCSITALNCKGTNLFGISNSLEFVQQMYIIMWLVGWVGKELSPVLLKIYPTYVYVIIYNVYGISTGTWSCKLTERGVGM